MPQSDQAIAPTLAIGDHTVRSLDGLFSLNDLHRASGANPAQRPNQFLRNEQTRNLIDEISNAQIRAIEVRRGAHGGTYGCRELVIAYAAWISAAFHLKVIRVFLAATAPQAAAEPAPPSLKYRRWLVVIDERGVETIQEVPMQSIVLDANSIDDVHIFLQEMVPLALLPKAMDTIVCRMAGAIERLQRVS